MASLCLFLSVWLCIWACMSSYNGALWSCQGHTLTHCRVRLTWSGKASCATARILDTTWSCVLLLSRVVIGWCDYTLLCSVCYNRPLCPHKVLSLCWCLRKPFNLIFDFGQWIKNDLKNGWMEMECFVSLIWLDFCQLISSRTTQHSDTTTIVNEILKEWASFFLPRFGPALILISVCTYNASWE